MKKLSAALLFLFCFTPIGFGQTNSSAHAAADYPIKVHVSGIHIRSHCGSFTNYCEDTLYADATLNGAKVDLMGDVATIAPGDYMGRLVKKSPPSALHEIGQKYEILLFDQTTWRCTVEGFSE